MWGLCMPNFSPLASMVCEEEEEEEEEKEEEVTDVKTDKGRHAISLTYPLALLARNNKI